MKRKKKKGIIAATLAAVLIVSIDTNYHTGGRQAVQLVWLA